MDDHKTLCTLWKSLEKNTKRWWKSERYLHFKLIFLLKNHSLKWIKDDKTQNKIFNFPAVGGRSRRLFQKFLRVWGLRVCMHYWKCDQFLNLLRFIWFFKVKQNAERLQDLSAWLSILEIALLFAGLFLTFKTSKSRERPKTSP